MRTILFIIFIGCWVWSCKKDNPAPIPDNFTVKIHAEDNKDGVNGWFVNQNGDILFSKQYKTAYKTLDTTLVFDKGSTIFVGATPNHISTVKLRVDYNNTYVEDSNIVDGKWKGMVEIQITLPK